MENKTFGGVVVDALLGPSSFFDLEGLPHRELFEVEFVWQILGKRLKEYMGGLSYGQVEGKVEEGAQLLSSAVTIGRGSVVESGAVIKGPVWIGENCQIRSHAYIREYTLIMDGVIIGHATETKGSVFLPYSAAPHFNYVGDSILGRNVNLGAGTILSNLKNVNEEIVLKIFGNTYATGLRKFGAILGDGTKTGCNSVLNPGALVGKQCIIYPLTSLAKGYYPDRTIIKLRQQQEQAKLEL